MPRITLSAVVHGLFILVLLLAMPSRSVVAEEPLRFGIFPYLSPQKLISIHKPLKDYLARHTDCAIELVSAPDFNTFIQRTKNQEYDLILTAPHMGRLAEKQGAYRRLVHSSNRSFAVFATWASAPFKSLEDIRGQKVAMPPKKAIVHHLALRHLHQHGIDPDTDIQVAATKSHNSARQSLLQKDVKVAVFGRPTWDNCSEQQKEQLRILSTSETIPGFMFMVSQSWPAVKQEKYRTLLLDFPATAEGKRYFSQSGLKPFIATDEATMSALDPYVEAIFGR